MFELIKKDIYKARASIGIRIFIVLLLKSPGFQVVIIYRLSSFLRKKRLAILSLILDRLMLHFWNAEIRSTAVIGGGLNIAHPTGIVIGGKVIIGENFSIRQNTTIGGNTGKFRENMKNWTQPVIGNNVLIGCNAAVLGPVKIANDVKIGACSLVINDIPDNEIWGGVPAKRIK